MNTPVRDRTLATTFGSRVPRGRRSPHGGLGPQRESDRRPIIAAVDASDVSLTAAREAARLAAELDAPLIFVYVRRWPWAGLGEPYYQRRLNVEMATARRALDAALAAAREEGVAAEDEILEGRPARRVVDFAGHRDARLVVLGSRRRRIGWSVSRRVIHAADRPVVVAPIGAVAVG